MQDPAEPSKSGADLEADAQRASGWEIYEIAISDDPYSTWREIRESDPVLDVGEGVFFVTGWQLVNELLRDPRHGAGRGVAASFGVTSGLAYDAMNAWLMALDGAPHVRARGLVRRAFTPRRVEALRGLIEETSDECIAAIEAGALRGNVDLVEQLAFRLPSEVIRSLFGFERDEWEREVVSVLRDTTGIEMIESLASAFDRRLTANSVPEGLLADLRTADDDFGALSDLEVVANAVLLVTAAIDTTAGLIGNSILCVLERAELADRLRSDPSVAARIVEETLRFEPPALSCSRTAGSNLELGGVEIPAGSQLLLSLGASNRDPERYPDPDGFDIDRDHTQINSFGGGRHVCLGATLARLEAEIVLQHLFDEERLPFELAEPAVWQKRNPTVRALESLVVRRAAAPGSADVPKGSQGDLDASR